MFRNLQLKLVVLTLVCLAPDGGLAVPPLQQFATQPSHQTAVLGSTAVLPCRVINRHGLVQWTRDGFGLGTIRLLEGFDRYSMIGSDEEGDFSLRISPVMLEDNAEYQCQVSHPHESPLRSRVVQMTVFVPPQPPVVSPPGPEVHATAGVPITLLCTSKEGRPSPEIQWLDGKDSVVHKGIMHHHELMQDGLRSHASAELTFTPTRYHNHHTMTCLTNNPALNTPLATKVKLNVNYPPEIDLVFEPDKLSEGLEGEVRCVVEANPSIVNYQWLRKGVEIADVDGPILKLGILSRHDHGSPLACEATNAVGTTRKTAQINVKYAPLFVTDPSSESAEPGEEVMMICRVDSNPKPKITWTHVDTNKFVGSGGELTVTAAVSSIGEYSCLVQVDGFAPLKGHMHLRLKGPPAIKAKQLVHMREGKPAVLQCRAQSVPHPLAVTWTRNGIPINTEPGSNYNITEEQLADGIVSTLTINKTTGGDFTKYNCTVVNEYGIDVKQIILQKQSSIPVLMIVGGGTSVVIVVLVVTLFIIYGRQSSMQDSKAEEAQIEMKLSGQVGVTNGIIRRANPGALDMSAALDTGSDGQEIDTNDVEVRKSSLLPANKCDSAIGLDQDRTTLERDGIEAHHQPRHSQAPIVFTSPNQDYMSSMNFGHKYTPLSLNGSSGNSYAQFTMGRPYVSPICATNRALSSTTPSNVARPPYTTSVTTNGNLNGHAKINGLNNHSTSNTGVKHDLMKDFRHEQAKDVEDLDTVALHSKYIIPTKAKSNPGTLV